jgi:hypothetical protein
VFVVSYQDPRYVAALVQVGGRAVRPTQVFARGLVHDVIDGSEDDSAVETGCGIVLATERMEPVVDQPTSCFVCISGDLEFQREVIARYGELSGMNEQGLNVEDYLNFIGKGLKR